VNARILVWLIGGVLLALGASACASTQEESAKIANAAKVAAAQQTRHTRAREHANHRRGGS
jgi:hypothetical protein